MRPVKDENTLCEIVASERLFWLDISIGDGEAWSDLLTNLNFEGPEISWMRRFGQEGCITISKEGLRAVTWLAGPAGDLCELHVLCTRRCLVTVWSGDPAILSEARQNFAEREGELEKSPYFLAGILLQLLLETLGTAISNLDSRIQDLRDQLEREPASIDFAMLKKRLHRFQSAWSAFDRFGSAVRLAMVGVEAVSGMDAPRNWAAASIRRCRRRWPPRFGRPDALS
jgi:hypothetical protein